MVTISRSRSHIQKQENWLNYGHVGCLVSTDILEDGHPLIGSAHGTQFTSGEITMTNKISPGAHLYPGAYLHHCVAPFADKSRAFTRTETPMERIISVLSDGEWRTISQITEIIGFDENTVRRCLEKHLLPQEKAEKKIGPKSPVGPRPMLWRLIR